MNSGTVDSGTVVQWYSEQWYSGTEDSGTVNSGTVDSGTVDRGYPSKSAHMVAHSGHISHSYLSTCSGLDGALIRGWLDPVGISVDGNFPENGEISNI